MCDFLKASQEIKREKPTAGWQPHPVVRRGLKNDNKLRLSNAALPKLLTKTPSHSQNAFNKWHTAAVLSMY